MTSVPREAPGRWSWRRPRTWIFALSVLILLLSAMVLHHFRYHLQWKFKAESIVGKLEPISVLPMPATGPTPGWYRCRIGPLTLRLPAKLIEQGERSAGAGISFEDEDLTIGIAMPSAGSGGTAAFEEQFRLQFPNREWTSFLRIEAELYGADTDRFRWSMSSEDARQFMLWMITARMTTPRVVESVETRFDSRIEGLLKFWPDDHAQFSWGTSDGNVGTFMIFKNKSGPLDRALVREICQSIQCEGILPRRWSKEETRRSLETMEMVPDQ